MACRAVGRCRICAQKHKIPVFGGAEAQHVIIEKFNFKLIILNTVCIACLAKVENFVKNMDLNLTCENFTKKEDLDFETDSTQLPDHPLTDCRMNIDSGAESSHHQHQQEMEIEPHRNQLTCGVNEMQNVKCNCGDCYICSTGLPIIADAVDMKTTTAFDPPTELGTYTTLEPSGSHLSHHGNITQHHKSETLPHLQLLHEGTSKETDYQNTMGSRQMIVSEPKQQQGRPSHDYFSPGETVHFANCRADRSLHPTKKHPRDLSCDYCEKKFTHAGDLNKHRRKHTGERPYECDQCLRKFAHASNLARHQRVHSGERPFSCLQCSQSFTRRDKLANHVAGGRCKPRSTTQQHTPT